MSRSRFTFPFFAATLLGLLLLTACTSAPSPYTMDDVANWYDARDYNSAYIAATTVQGDSRGETQAQASYYAGMSAWQLGNRNEAAARLRRATLSGDSQLRARANASLGIVLSELEQYDTAADALLAAAPYLPSTEQANAYFFAALAQQKLGQDTQARTNFMLARRASSDPDFVRRVDEQLAVTGYTLQFGAYTNPANAQQRADELSQYAPQWGVGSPRLVTGVDEQGSGVTYVRMGMFTTYQNALAARDRINDPSCFIVQLRQTR